MPSDFNRATLFNSSIINFSCSIGWGANQVSQCEIELVDDPARGDSFSAVRTDIGKPVYFEYYGFQFYGLLQRYVTKKGRDGLPIYHVTLHDPRELLEGAQIIFGDYNGIVQGIPNLFNVFGYWENNAGFGSSLVTDSGMPWVLIRNALIAIANTPVFGLYGGPISHNGYSYGLDLNELPTTPADYRISGTHASLLDIIAQVCDDAGYDFFVELTGLRIRVRTQSRRVAPPFGVIPALSTTGYGNNLVSSEAGVEARNDASANTSVFLVGGKVQSLYLGTTLSSFWGFDVNGSPIIGNPTTYTTGGVEYDVDEMYLNASPVADILGSTSYYTNTLEMRLALYGRNIWDAFIDKDRPAISNLVGGNFAAFRANVANVQLPHQLVNDARARAFRAAGVNALLLNEDAAEKRDRLYNFVRKHAETYYGKKFIVRIPFVYSKTDSQTGVISYSQEPTDAGYVADGASLSMPLAFQDLFTLQDGRFIAHAFSGSYRNIAIERLSPSDTVITDGTTVFNVWTKVNIDPNIVFTSLGVPAVIATVSTPLFKTPEDIRGGFGVIDAAAINQQGVLQRMQRLNAGGNIPLGTGQEAITPDYIAIPLKSNVLTYGPWYATAAAGRVRYEQDDTLNPWNYGGYAGMNTVANAKIVNAVSLIQIYETGTLELTGTPTAKLGDVLDTGCPNITNITVQISENKISTTYHFKTYTPRFGVFSRDKAEKIRKLTALSQNMRKMLKGAAKFQLEKATAEGDAFRGALANLPRQERGESPHPVLISQTANLDGGTVMPMVSLATNEEAVIFSNADEDQYYQQTAIMSLNGLLRPIKSCATGTPSGNMSSYTYPSGDTQLNSAVLHPFDATASKGQVDVPFLTTDRTYPGLNTGSLDTVDSGVEKRFIGLRGPLVVTGWGYDIHGKPTPGTGGSFSSNLFNNSHQWKSGPVDLLWHPYRGCWTSHGFAKGILRTTLNAFDENTGVEMDVWNRTVEAGFSIKVYNWLSSIFESGARVFAGYSPESNRWYVINSESRNTINVSENTGLTIAASGGLSFGGGNEFSYIPRPSGGLSFGGEATVLY